MFVIPFPPVEGGVGDEAGSRELHLPASGSLVVSRVNEPRLEV